MARKQPPFDSFMDSPRLAARVMSEFLLKQWSVLAQTTEGDLYRAVVFIGLVTANIQHLEHTSRDGRTFSALDQAPPDAMRRPISTHALAHMLGLPYETTRRNVNALIAEGMVERTPGGLVVPTAYLESEINVSNLTKALGCLDWLLVTLRSAGFDLNAVADRAADRMAKAPETSGRSQGSE